MKLQLKLPKEKDIDRDKRQKKHNTKLIFHTNKYFNELKQIMQTPLTKKDSEFLIYEGKDGKTVIDVRFEGQDIWLTQDQLAMLFGVERAGITQHIRNIFAEGELQEISVGKKFLRTAADGKKYTDFLP